MAGVIGNEDLRKDRQQMLYDLICQDNPKFKEVFGVNDFTVSAITAITADAYGRNTSCKIRPAVNDGSVVGERIVKYRRRDLNVLFRGVVLDFTEYRAADSTTKEDFIATFEKYYGVRFHPDDFTQSAWVVTVGNSSNTMSPASGSWCWLPGSTKSVWWRKGKIPLATIIGNASLAGRNWPQAMVAIGDGAKPQGELLAYDLDCTPNRTELLALSNGVFDNGSWNTSLNLGPTVAFLNANIPGITWSRADYRASSGGIGYMTHNRYSLPNAAVPEANSAKYKYCSVLTPVVANQASSWVYGKILLHYN